MSRDTDRYWRAVRERREAGILLSGATPNRRRITQALDLRELEGPEVDIACGGAEPMVDEWEAGTRTPTTQQLQLLADLTGFTVEFFYLHDPPPLTGFICQRTGRGKGCTPIDTRPAAPIVGTIGRDVSRETSAFEPRDDTLF